MASALMEPTPSQVFLEYLRSLGPAVIVSVIAILVALHFVRPSPPRHLTIASGPPGSKFNAVALRYEKILAREGIALTVIASEGSLDNLQRMSDPASGVDIALVQDGVGNAADATDLVSLGSVFYQPLTIFYRSSKPLVRLAELLGQHVAIGPVGSGTHSIALVLLGANGIEPGGPTELLDLDAEAARDALQRGQVDAMFLSGDSAAPETIRAMLRTSGIRLYGFPQADAYVRRFPYLSKLEVPAGAFDLGENLPPEPVTMLAPAVELLAHPDLHPALSDLLIEAAIEVHGGASLLQNAGDFPSMRLHEYPISADAARYYKSGKSFAYRYMTFWLASLVDRAGLVLLPLLFVVVPALRYLPALYHWRIKSRLDRRYRLLMELEQQSLGELTPEQRRVLIERLAEIERSVIALKTPGSHAEQMYVLRQHMRFVRENLERVHERSGVTATGIAAS
jgi:TRAP-type uncharacterized transport system substrate-binding protein